LKKRWKNLTPEILRARAVGWLQERIDLGPALAFAAKKKVPSHRHTWIYLLGGAALFLLGLQVASGCLLMLYYQPTEASAHESVARIMTEVPYGWLVRSVHVWGANLLIGLVCLHFLTVLFTRAYRKPRELTWLSGVVMLFLVLGSGFSGYLLPWNELSYYATRVGTDIPRSVPGVGGFIVHFLRGGDQVTGGTITRMYAAHVVIVPLTLGLALLAHLALIQAQGMSLPLGMTETQVKDHRPFFTEFAIVDACAWLVLFGVIITLAMLLPAHTGVKADTLKPAPVGVKPEWYFLFMYQTLKMLPETASVALFALGGVFLVALPFLDWGAARGKRSRALTALFAAGVAYVVAFDALAWTSPGVEHPPEKLAAETFSIPASLVSLAILWSLIGFLVFYLWQLLKENSRVRRLYGGMRDEG
jgi:cytochrome b6